MKYVASFIALVAVGVLALNAQMLQSITNSQQAASNPPITLGVHAAHDNGAGTATTVVVGPMTPTAHSTIYCTIKYSNSSTITSVADNVNSGVYQPAFSRLRDNNHDFVVGSYYKENVAGSATTITLTYTTTSTHGQMACMEIKGTPQTYTLDSTVLQQKAANGTNPVNPNSYTPFANGEMVASDVYASTGTVTAGTSFTLLDAASTFNPEYWIQTAKTATTGAFVNGSASDYGIGMAAFGPNVGGNCDGTMVIDWTGGANAGTPTTTTLQNSTKGGQAEPNADKLSNPPGWSLGGAAAGITYATAAYRPLVTTRTCPFYSGTGTGTLGLDKASGAVGALTYFFDGQQSKVTMFSCISTTTPVAHAGTIDTIGIHGDLNIGNPDFVLMQFNSNGAAATFELEAQGGSTNSSTAWLANTAYGIRLEYNTAGAHKGYIYTFSGANCTGTPTLQETLTASGSVAGGALPQSFNFFSSSDSYAGGTDWYVGATIVDILYGSALLP